MVRFLVGAKEFFDGDDESFVPADVGQPLGVGLELVQSALALKRDDSGFLDEVTKLTIQSMTQTPNAPTIQATTVSGFVFLVFGFLWEGGLESAAATKFENGSLSDISSFCTITEEE